jgi:hypothetical protein
MITPYYWKHRGVEDATADDKGRLIFADAVYFRDPDWILDRGDPEQVYRAILCFLAYDYKRTARYCLEQAVRRKMFPALDHKGVDRLFA